MFRLVFLTFHGERRDAPARPAHRRHRAGTRGRRTARAHWHRRHHGHGAMHGHLHDAPPAMALALIVLAIGSVLAGYVGVPHALGGSNRIERSSSRASRRRTARAVERRADREPPAAAARGRARRRGGADAARQLELTLMGVSSVVALAGIGIAWLLLAAEPRAPPTRSRARFAGLHTLLLNKYYVDEIYDAAIVQPIKLMSDEGLWKGVDAGVIDGAVNGVGARRARLAAACCAGCRPVRSAPMRRRCSSASC